ncbi:MAG: hypothetical protein IT426_13570 [Pirellulales bacterium]|nr:hypothetical protein [Pirellulales bacterium]
MRFFPNSSLRRLRFSRLGGVVFALWAVFLLARPVGAGGGPENLFLVVNPRSADSMTIANFYLHAREIPPGNVFYLPWDPQRDGVPVDEFRNAFLKPILGAIRSRRLAGQIDYVVYSSDFPHAVTLDADLNKFQNPPVTFKAMPKPPPSFAQVMETVPEASITIDSSLLFHPVGSLSGMTFLWSSVLRGSPEYVEWQSNRYMRMPFAEQKDSPTLGFRSAVQFGPRGELAAKDGATYLLSTMLGVTSGRGNSVGEVLSYLERSAKADGTHPAGTVYFAKNNDIRSTVRDGLFSETVEALKKAGVEARIVEGSMPLGCPDVQGVCMGTANYYWKASGSTLLPGALCDNFTSYGGVLRKNFDMQTPLSDFLRFGAAGASGTVTEPSLLWQKFPLPLIQLHYARGCTLAEAFYQSVYGPYQLLIVGDPLCRPWANVPKVEVKGIEDGDAVKGELVLSPAGKMPRGGSIDRFELFVNGSRAAQCKPGETLKLDTAVLPDGYQELRVVAVESGIIQSQGRAIHHIVTENHGRKIEALKVPRGPFKPGDTLRLEVKSPGSIGVAVVQNGRSVGRAAGEEGIVEISADKLGAGKVRLQAVGIGKGGPRSHVLATPVEVEVEANK